MKNVVIIGATSFIGRHLTSDLQNKEYNLYLVVRNKEKCPKLWDADNVTILEYDIDSYEDLYKVLPKDIFCMFSFTWLGTKSSQRDDETIQEHSYICMKGCLENILKNCNVKMLVTPGTIYEYGIQKDKFSEESECTPLGNYGRYKYMFFEQVKALCESFSTKHIHVRIFAIYGNDDEPYKLINSTVLKLLRKEKVVLNTSCTQRWNLLHIDDLIRFFDLCLEGKVEEGCVNIGSFEEASLRDYLERIQKVLKTEDAVAFATEKNTAGELNMNGDFSKIQKVSQWKPLVDFEDGIRSMKEYYADKFC